MKRIAIFAILICGIVFGIQRNWRLSLWIDAEIQHHLVIGMDSAATDGFDAKIDRAAPPVPPVGFFAYIPCNDPKYSYIPALWHDIRSHNDSAMWTIRLANAKVPVIVEWNPDSLPTGFVAIAEKSLRKLKGQYKVPSDDTMLIIRYNKDKPIEEIPNPSAIRFSLSTSASVQIAITDKEGNMVDALNPGRLSGGDHSITWNSSAKAGVYFYRVEADGREITTGKIVALGGK